MTNEEIRRVVESWGPWKAREPITAQGLASYMRTMSGRYDRDRAHQALRWMAENGHARVIKSGQMVKYTQPVDGGWLSKPWGRTLSNAEIGSTYRHFGSPV